MQTCGYSCSQASTPAVQLYTVASFSFSFLRKRAKGKGTCCPSRFHSVAPNADAERPALQHRFPVRPICELGWQQSEACGIGSQSYHPRTPPEGRRCVPPPPLRQVPGAVHSLASHDLWSIRPDSMCLAHAPPPLPQDVASEGTASTPSSPQTPHTPLSDPLGALGGPPAHASPATAGHVDAKSPSQLDAVEQEQQQEEEPGGGMTRTAAMAPRRSDPALRRTETEVAGSAKLHHVLDVLDHSPSEFFTDAKLQYQMSTGPDVIFVEGTPPRTPPTSPRHTYRAQSRYSVPMRTNISTCSSSSADSPSQPRNRSALHKLQLAARKARLFGLKNFMQDVEGQLMALEQVCAGVQAGAASRAICNVVGGWQCQIPSLQSPPPPRMLTCGML